MQSSRGSLKPAQMRKCDMDARIVFLRLRACGQLGLFRLFRHRRRALLRLLLTAGGDQGQPLHLMHHHNGVHQLLLEKQDKKLVQLRSLRYRRQ